MFVEPPPVVHLLLGAAVLGVVVGLLWIHRIGGAGEDRGRPIFRYQGDREPRRRPPQRRRFARPRLPDAIRRRTTRRWLVTRLELAVGVVSVVLAAAPTWLRAFGGYIPRPMLASPWFDLLPILGLAGAVIGLVWMLRIAWHDPEARPSIWRSYRD